MCMRLMDQAQHDGAVDWPFPGDLILRVEPYSDAELAANATRLLEHQNQITSTAHDAEWMRNYTEDGWRDLLNGNEIYAAAMVAFIRLGVPVDLTDRDLEELSKHEWGGRIVQFLHFFEYALKVAAARGEAGCDARLQRLRGWAKAHEADEVLKWGLGPDPDVE
ncbi:hypothetical protein H9P43_002937 [Blastocladiella emersonii ATCC 22665]|nr:hypothetical protein H9P43_002937 [Blastocladiella emersonii ATCC 22665]